MCSWMAHSPCVALTYRRSWCRQAVVVLPDSQTTLALTHSSRGPEHHPRQAWEPSRKPTKLNSVLGHISQQMFIDNGDRVKTCRSSHLCMYNSLYVDKITNNYGLACIKWFLSIKKWHCSILMIGVRGQRRNNGTQINLNNHVLVRLTYNSFKKWCIYSLSTFLKRFQCRNGTFLLWSSGRRVGFS